VILNTNKPVKRASLLWMSNDVTKVEITRLPSQEVGRNLIWSAKIDAPSRVRVPATVVLHVEYVSDGVVKHAFSTLTLSSQADGAGRAVEASIEGNFDAVSEQRPGFGHLVVTNNLDVPVHIDAEGKVPMGIFKPPAIPPFDVPARSVVDQSITLDVDKKTTPGTYSILFSLDATWPRADYQEKRHLVASKTATAGVFFESELLKVLGVPSFLVLPGCLVLFTMQVMLTLGVFGLKNDSRLPQLTITSPGFWVLAISFSGAFALVYTALTSTNYLLRYGAEDLRNVWLWCIAVGIGTYLLYAGLSRNWRRKHVPTADDEPIPLLSKMAENKVPIDTSTVKFKVGSIEFAGQVIEKVEDGMPLLWVTPKISVTWADTDEARTAQHAFETAINEKRNAGELAHKLKVALAAGDAVSVRWSTHKASIPHPYHVKMDAITDYLQPEKIFDV